jgi:hypothetical protein
VARVSQDAAAQPHNKPEAEDPCGLLINCDRISRRRRHATGEPAYYDAKINRLCHAKARIRSQIILHLRIYSRS